MSRPLEKTSKLLKLPAVHENLTPPGKICFEEMRFFPDFVQQYSLKKHCNATEARYGIEEGLCFAAFVETMCRICFCSLS